MNIRLSAHMLFKMLPNRQQLANKIIDVVNNVFASYKILVFMKAVLVLDTGLVEEFCSSVNAKDFLLQPH